jgi:hypothetical protein
VPDPVHAREHNDQGTALDPPVDLALRKTGIEELTPPDDPVRPTRDPRHLLIIRKIPPGGRRG